MTEKSVPVDPEPSFASRTSLGTGGDPLWAITSYFNPAGYARRLINYRTFRQRLPIPLVTVELASSRSKLALRPGDADILIQLLGNDQLWQKERLLNIALAAVPRECRKIAWLDCDVVFPQNDWGQRVSDALERIAVVQAYRTFYELPLQANGGGEDPTAAYGSGNSLAFRLSNGTAPTDLLRKQGGNRIQRRSSCGLAWAARRDVLDRHRFYDGCILGGGDKAMAVANIGLFESAILSLDLNEHQRAHYLAWGRPYFDDVRGNLGFVDADICHLWHGDLKHRKHRQRHREFVRFNFNPYRDIALDDQGVWCWTSRKPEMHEFLRAYFASRDEDGEHEPLRPMPSSAFPDTP